MLRKLREKVRNLKQEIVPIYYAMFDKRTPMMAKVLAGLTIGYLLSPIDLIPDFIPILGLLDDLIIIPLFIKLTVRLIPASVMNDIRSKIDKNEKLHKKWFYALPIIAIYGYLLFITFRYIKHWFYF